jgi:hypothetical protein
LAQLQVAMAQQDVPAISTLLQELVPGYRAAQQWNDLLYLASSGQAAGLADKAGAEEAAA